MKAKSDVVGDAHASSVRLCIMPSAVSAIFCEAAIASNLYHMSVEA